MAKSKIAVDVKASSEPMAFLIKFDADVFGKNKYVDFAAGEGVLSEGQILANRPEWEDPENPGKMKPGVRHLIRDYVRYWEDKGATVTALDPDDAKKKVGSLQKVAAKKVADLEAGIESEPETPKLPAGLAKGSDMKAKKKSKSKSKDKPPHESG